MSEEKINVPVGMLKAVHAYCEEQLISKSVVPFILEAALLWQRENPPNEKIINSYCEENFKGYDGTAQRIGFRMGVDYVRRMYDEPEPEVPEAIKDLLLPDIESGFFKPEILNERIAEAFRRGQKVGPK